MKKKDLMRRIQVPIIWTIAILFGAGVIWWSVASYLAGQGQNNEEPGTNLSHENSVAYLTKDGTPLDEERYFVTVTEFERRARQNIDNIRQQGQEINAYFGTQQVPSEIEIRHMVLKNLIEEKILTYYTVNEGIYPTQEELDAQTDAIVNKYTSDENTKNQIINVYGSIEAFRSLVEDTIIGQILVNKVKDHVFTDVEDKLSKYFEENKESIKKKYEKVNASHILVTSEATANEIKEMITSGEIEFTTAASEFSIDTNSAMTGGSLGEIQRGDMVEKFEEAAFSATPNVIVGPVETQYGYHLIKVASKTTFNNFEELKLSSVYSDVKNDYLNQEFQKWFEKYKEENNISYVIKDSEMKLYDRYQKVKESEEELNEFYKELEDEIFMDNGQIVLSEGYLPIVLYTKITDEKKTKLEDKKSKLTDIIEYRESLPSTVLSLTPEEVEEKINEINESDDKSELSNYQNAQTLFEYENELGISGKAEAEEMLKEIEEKLKDYEKSFEKVVRFIYEEMPYSPQVVKYMYEIEPNDPKVVFRYYENFYEQNLKPIINDPSTYKSYLSYYQQYFGNQARNYLIEYPLNQMERELNQKIIESTEASTDTKISALFLIVDTYEKLSNLEQSEGLMQLYMMAERRYLRMLKDLMPEDKSLQDQIDEITSTLEELNKMSQESTETSTDLETDIEMDSELDTSIDSDSGTELDLPDTVQ
ncbi:MAG: parvulin peptidyl-prolyl isomerase [Kosmotoga sp.]|nr:MAG: parvulin peptidyl-prolyl isomerase [Kosmotoga sp.]